MPDWLADKQKRLEKIRQAKAELEAEAKAAAEEEMRRREEAEKQRKAEGRKKNGKTPASPKTKPEGKAQRNFTDPESRILKTKDGYIQGYNAQAAVDAQAQIIVAQSLTHSMSDQDQLVPLIDGIKDNLGRKPKEAQPMPVTAPRQILPPWPSARSALTSLPDAPSTLPKADPTSPDRSFRRCGTS